MSNPKIRFDILASASGSEEVEKLARSVESLDSAVDPSTAENGKRLASAIRDLGREAGAIESFRKLKADTQAASTALEAARARASAFARDLRQSGSASASQAREMQRLREAVRSAKAEYDASNQALNRQRQALYQAGIATTNLSRAQADVALRMQMTTMAIRSVEEAHGKATRAVERNSADQGRSHRRVREGVESISQAVSRFEIVQSTLASAAGLSAIVSDATKAADAYNSMSARIKLVTGDGEALQRAMQGVTDVAVRTGTSLETTGNLFTRLAQAGKQIGVTQAESLRLTETINQAVQVSGASAQASDAAITQLIQGLQSGVLRGEEFNSVMEQAPRLAQALADGLGVTTGQLRMMAGQGELTAATVIKALQGQSEAVRTEFNQLPATVGRALTNLQTSWTAYVGDVDKTYQVTSRLAGAITALASNLETIGAVAEVAIRTLTGLAALKIFEAFVQTARGARDASVAVQASTAAIASHTVATTTNAAAQRASAAAAATSAAASVAAARGSAAAAALESIEVGRGARAKGAYASATRAAAAEAGKSAGIFSRIGDAFRASTSAVGAFTQRLGPVGVALRGVGSLFQILGGPAGIIAAVVFNLDLLLKAGHRVTQMLTGQSEATRKAEQAARAQREEIERQKAQEKELAEVRRVATEASLGYTAKTRSLIAEFAKLREQGASVKNALDGVAKSLRLESPTGIRDAGLWLDKLRQTGEITAEQMRNVFAQEIEAQNLQVFLENARAAFRGTSEDAKILRTITDAIADESLRRAGTSALELRTGLGDAVRSSLADVDMLATSIERMAGRTEEAGPILSRSLDKALEAANTERAVIAVMDSMQRLGQKGLLTGEQVRAGMQKAQAKLDEMRPGINSVAEAFAALGVTTREEMKRVADANREAWERVRNDSSLVLADRQAAFQSYAQRAIEANGGIASASLRSEAAMVGLHLEIENGRPKFKRWGDSAHGDLGRVGDQADKTHDKLERMNRQADRAVRRVPSGGADSSDDADTKPTPSDPRYSPVNSDRFTPVGNNNKTKVQEDGSYTDQFGERRDAKGNPIGSFNNQVPVDKAYAIIERLRAGTLTGDDLAEAQAAVQQVERARQQLDAMSGLAAGSVSPEAFASTNALQIGVQQAMDAIQGKIKAEEQRRRIRESSEARIKATRPVAEPSEPPVAPEPRAVRDFEPERVTEMVGSPTGKVETSTRSTTHRVEINLGGVTRTIDTRSPEDASRLVAMLQQLEGFAQRGVR